MSTTRCKNYYALQSTRIRPQRPSMHTHIRTHRDVVGADNNKISFLLVWCYKILFDIVNVQSDKFFEFNTRPSRGHQYKLYKNHSVSRVRAAFFSERVVNVWNSLPDSVAFNTLSKLRRSVMRVDFSKFLRCF